MACGTVRCARRWAGSGALPQVTPVFDTKQRKEALTFGELPLEPFARADLFRTARADTLGAQAPAGLRKQITKRCVPSGPSASRASKPRSWRSGSRFQFLNLVHDRWPLVSISLPRSTNPPLGSRQSALISVTSVARPRRQHLGGGLSYASEMVPETDLGGHGRVVRTEGKSIRTALLRTCPAPSDRAQRRAPARSRTRAAGSWRKLCSVGAAHVVVESRSWPRPRDTKRAIARSWAQIAPAHGGTGFRTMQRRPTRPVGLSCISTSKCLSSTSTIVNVTAT